MKSPKCAYKLNKFSSSPSPSLASFYYQHFLQYITRPPAASTLSNSLGRSGCKNMKTEKLNESKRAVRVAKWNEIMCFKMCKCGWLTSLFSCFCNLIALTSCWELKPPVDELFIEGSVGRRKKLRKERVMNKIYLIYKRILDFSCVIFLSY